MAIRRAKITAVLLIAAVVLSGCGRGITLTITNGCEHTLDAQVFVYLNAPGEKRGPSLSDSGDVERYAVGETNEMFFHISPYDKLYAEIITNADGAARADHFADGHDLPNDYTISGDMCLPPAAASE